MSTTLKLISNIKLKGSFPSSDELFSNDDYLSVLDEEMLSRAVPLLNKANEEFFLTYKDYTIQANKVDYRIPSRASASILRGS